MSTENTTRSGNRSRLWLGLVAGAVALTAAAAIALPPRVAAHAAFAHGRAFHGGDFDPADAREKVDFVASWVLERVDATPEQEAAIESRLFRAVDDLSVLALSHGDHREQVREILTAEEIDRIALEELRTDGIATADEASRIVAEAVADVAEILEPEQRLELAEMAERFHGRRH